MRAVLLAGGLLVCFGAAWAAPGPRPDPLDLRQSALLEKYLAGAPDPADLRDGGGATAQTLAFLGREDLVMSAPFSHRRRNCAPLLDKEAPVDPIAYVTARASDFRVTMINEAHDMPQTRAFDAAVAAALRPKGYAWYGAETFYDGIGKDGPAWPSARDGYYVGEPVYGRLIRDLRRLGYRLFAYEFSGLFGSGLSRDAQVNRREAGQAENLAARLRAIPQPDKVLVHVGYGHLNKNDAPVSPVKMMAARFRQDTGIDPLTVDQTVFWSRDGAYAVCDPAALHISDPTQIFVSAPRPAFSRKRPGWRLEAGDRFAEIPAALRRPDEIAIYEARRESEPDMAIPLDRLLVRPGEDIPLLLPPGRYRLAVWTAKTGWSAAIPLSVDGRS